MSNVLTSYRLWIAGSHRHHHSGSDLGEVPGLPASTTYSTTWEMVDAPDPVGDDHFLFWSASGDLDHGSYYPSPTTSAAFPPGGAPGSLTAWYVAQPPGPPGPPGVRFDAFSLESGDFLDWGDGPDPFTVDPAAERVDDLVSTESGGANLTAAEIWPGPGPALRFEAWLTFGFASPVPGPGADLVIGRQQSGDAFALYATPASLKRFTVSRIPPIVELNGDYSAFTDQAVQLTNLAELAGRLTDRPSSTDIQRVVLNALLTATNTQIKSLDPSIAVLNA